MTRRRKWKQFREIWRRKKGKRQDLNVSGERDVQDRFLSRTRELDEGDQWGNKEVEEEMEQRRQRRMQYCVRPHGVSIGAQQWAHAGGLLCGGAADDLLPSGTSGHNKLVVAAACCQIHLSVLQPAPLQVLQETADSAASPVFVSVLHTLLNTFTPGSSTGEGLKKSSKVVLERRIVLTPGGRIINLSCLTQSRSYLGPKRWFTLFVGLVLHSWCLKTDENLLHWGLNECF